MKRRGARWSMFALGVLLLALLGGLAAALKHEPEFYTQAEVDPLSLDITGQSARLMTRVQDLLNDVATKPEWGATFGADELNCFLHDYAGEGSALTSGRVVAPRLNLDGDRIRVGFRYGREPLSTIFWVEAKVWLVQSEPNCLAVEIMAIRAGALPLGLQSILDNVTDVARESNIDVSWYRHEGKPVGLFRFFADQGRRPPKQFKAFQIHDGKLTVAGKTTLEGSGIPAGAVPLFGPDR